MYAQSHSEFLLMFITACSALNFLYSALKRAKEILTILRQCLGSRRPRSAQGVHIYICFAYFRPNSLVTWQKMELFSFLSTGLVCTVYLNSLCSFLLGKLNFLNLYFSASHINKPLLHYIFLLSSQNMGEQKRKWGKGS